MNGDYVIELFSFSNPLQRVSRREASGLRHLAFEVEYVEYKKEQHENKGVFFEPVRINEFTQKKFA